MEEQKKTVKIGDTIVVDGYELVIMDMSTSASVEGRSIIIRALDAESAQHQQAKQIRSDQAQLHVVEMIKKMFGGNLPETDGGD